MLRTKLAWPAPSRAIVDTRYARDGRVLKGQERALTKSKYEEDVLVGLGCGKQDMTSTF